MDCGILNNYTFLIFSAWTLSISVKAYPEIFYPIGVGKKSHPFQALIFDDPLQTWYESNVFYFSFSRIFFNTDQPSIPEAAYPW